MTWRILITDGLGISGLAHLRQHAEVDEGDLDDHLETTDAVIVRSRTRITTDVIERAPSSLKVIGRAGVGVDNIDLDAAAGAGVTVVNSPEALTDAVAELALGLMLALARHISIADRAMKEGEWPKKQLMGSELSGKTLGVIGVGRIGAALAKRAAALGMEVVGYDAIIPPEEIRAQKIGPVELDALLASSDYISLHVPLLDNTRGMIGDEAFSKVKPGARLISTARGGVADESALLAALENGQLAGAALDVFEEEPPGATALIQHPNVITTPHLGAQTAEAQERTSMDIASEVLAALDDKPLRWQVA